MVNIIKSPNRSQRYRGFHIVKHPDGDRYQVRLFQHDPDLIHVWNPWCDTIEEAKAVVDKLILNAGELEDAGETKRS
jgi:hypothetical protein